MYVKYKKVKVFAYGDSKDLIEEVELIPFSTFGVNVYNYNGISYKEYLDNELNPCIRLDSPA